MAGSRKHWLIALGVAAAYLIVSVSLNGWAWSWLIWVLYALWRFLGR